MGEQKSTRGGLARKGMSCTPALVNRSPQAAAQEWQCRKRAQAICCSRKMGTASPTQLGARLPLLMLNGQAASQHPSASRAGSCQQPWMQQDHPGVHRDAPGLPGCLPWQHKAQGGGPQASGGSSLMVWWELTLSGYSLSFHTGESSNSCSHHTNTDPASSALHDTHSVPLQRSSRHTQQRGSCHSDLSMATAAHTTAPGKPRATADSSN